MLLYLVFQETPSSIESPTTLWRNQESYQTFYPIPTPKSRPGNTNTEVIGGIRRQNEATGILGLCTHSGAFMVLDSYANSEVLKNRTEHRWFAMSKIDVTRDGDDEIVICSMDGMTNIIDKEHEILSFNFKDTVAAFCAGNYAFQGDNVPCLCYVTLNGRIHMYHRVFVESMKVQCVHGALMKKLNTRAEYSHVLEALRLPSGEIDHLKIQKLVKQIWSAKSNE